MSLHELIVHDLLGVGFGPANMALGVLLQEEQEAGGATPSRLFLEARSEPCWHPGMLLDGSLIQITVLKDLALVRNPRSRFTFLNYLHEKGRLFHFLNLRDLFPSRYEFNDYLGWVADQLGDVVRCGRRVTQVTPVGDGAGGVDLLEVTAETAAGDEERFRARNLVVATGGTPWVPPGVEMAPGGRVFHASEFLHRLERDYPDRSAPYRFVVVGAGQSGAELFHYLMTRYPQADVTAAVRGHGYKPVDESDFTNEVFFPEKVDFLYELPEDQRRRMVASYRDVNYAVVDAPLIKKIYRLLYDERVEGRQRARLLPYLEVRSVRDAPGAAVLDFEHVLTREPMRLEADAAVLCTGFRWSTRHPLLEGLAPWLATGADGEYRVERDYGIAPARDDFRPRVYLQGYCEATHGISETVLSLLPMRAGDVARSLARRLAGAETGVPEPALNEAETAELARRA
ncbi:MAG TPA: SidA/IucD/PvdA family monooxygenase [Thermoanaerobaculia bacterium]|nr:SidA/IucD/PvdA family monooxygenase [Thermoanaerobaculia bacterium]